jgi:hypothetical protein
MYAYKYNIFFCVFEMKKVLNFLKFQKKNTYF